MREREELGRVSEQAGGRWRKAYGDGLGVRLVAVDCWGGHVEGRCVLEVRDRCAVGGRDDDVSG